MVNGIFFPISLISSLGTSTETTLPSKPNRQVALTIEIYSSKPRDANAAQEGGNKIRKRRENMRYVP